MKNNSLLKLLKKIHADEGGTVSIETVLIIGAIALVIMAFLLMSAWPKIKAYFNQGLTDLQDNGAAASQ
jgi:hypothetical protein